MTPNNLIKALLPALKRQLGPEQGSLLALPQNVLEVRRLCNEDDSSIGQVSSAVVQDPAFAGYLLQMANSAMYGFGWNECTRIEDSIKRLGLQRVAKTSLLYASRQLHQDQHVPREMRPLLQTNWQRSWQLVKDASEAYWKRRGRLPEHHFPVAIADVLTASVLYFSGALAILSIAARESELLAEHTDLPLERTALLYNRGMLRSVLTLWGMGSDYAKGLADLPVEGTSLCRNDFIRLALLNQPEIAIQLGFNMDTQEEWRERLTELRMLQPIKVA
ncbi:MULTISPECIES: HDOD domain-containing protein [Corallincola]|uniref:HDOD domain-containing protein n=3 Tax=Corallincola TaxID=1775176 RepID=A0A368NII9_9GAMM|nr:MULTISPECIES: HDOD domain-containing protein [Corallincola]RCU49201.1 HDOD domain-containing protein [Corallincola holothuriorum]TAA47498.1 HDOD domain-containing protein [Corallincola spongiicola]TCI05180.1 HDOD domain-containing protein [Corallincola luteus]